MPLHDNLEKKRRQNISQLNASGGCHICGSTCRTSHLNSLNGGIDNGVNDGNAFSSRFVDADESGEHEREHDAATANGSIVNNNSNNNPKNNNNNPSPTPMKTCSCFGIPPSDPNYWPYSLRVCTFCILDDVATGRIRCCGICGVVACDENCGAELVECTDSEEWNNAGCLECRGKESFSDIALFRQAPPHEHHPRMTRICTKCLHLSTPWIKYDFTCRRFKCNTRLVPSSIAERKRFCTFSSSPLNSLPEDGLVAVVDFLSGKELKQLFLTCSALCTVAERVAKEKAERVSHAFPTGPIVETKKMKGLGKWVLAEGDNDFGLRAPEDCKSWVGILNYMERMTRDAFYFGFQMERDSGVASRFLQSRNKFTFGPTYRNVSAGIQPGETCLSIRGGQLHVSGQFPGIVGSSHIASSERTLQTGIYRIICRIFCPFSSDSSRPTIDILGSIGILRKTHGDEPLINWAHKETVLEGWQREEGIVGLEYNANTRVLKAHQIAFRPAGRIITSEVTIDDLEGDLYFAAELTSKAVEVKNTLLSVRKCDEQEYSEFVSHISEDLSYIIDRRGRDRMGFFGNMEDIRIDNDDDGDNRRIRHLRMLRRQNGDMQERVDPGNARRDRQFDEAVVAEPVVRYFFNADAPREPNDLQPQEHNEEPQNAASRVLARLRGAIDGRREQRQMEMRRESRSNALEPRRREEEIMHDALDVDANVDILFENPPPDDIPRMADRGMFRQIVRPTNARQGAAIRDVQPARQEAVALQEVEEIELDNAVRQEFHRRHYPPPDDMVPRWRRRGSTFRQNIPIGQPTNVRQGAAIRDVQPARQEAVALQEVEVDVAFAMQPENEGPDMADVLETSGVRQAFRQEAVAMQPEIHWADFDVLEEFVDDE